MKLSYLIKATPFLSTLVLIIFLCISNQKDYTKIKILIWSTPSLTLGNYLAISTGTGFILSYILTSKIASFKKVKLNNSRKYKVDVKNEESNEYIDSNNNTSYGNTLIERNINDPSPTINASFRVIGKTERINTNFKDNNAENDTTNEFDEDYYEQPEKSDSIVNEKSISSDWNDVSFLSW